MESLFRVWSWALIKHAQISKLHITFHIGEADSSDLNHHYMLCYVTRIFADRQLPAYSMLQK